MKKRYNNRKKISWISIKRINNQHLLSDLNLEKKERKKKNLSEFFVFFSFLAAFASSFGIKSDDEFSCD